MPERRIVNQIIETGKAIRKGAGRFVLATAVLSSGLPFLAPSAQAASSSSGERDCRISHNDQECDRTGLKAAVQYLGVEGFNKDGSDKFVSTTTLNVGAYQNPLRVTFAGREPQLLRPQPGSRGHGINEGTGLPMAIYEGDCPDNREGPNRFTGEHGFWPAIGVRVDFLNPDGSIVFTRNTTAFCCQPNLEPDATEHYRLVDKKGDRKEEVDYPLVFSSYK